MTDEPGSLEHQNQKRKVVGIVSRGTAEEFNEMNMENHVLDSMVGDLIDRKVKLAKLNRKLWKQVKKEIKLDDEKFKTIPLTLDHDTCEVYWAEQPQTWKEKYDSLMKYIVKRNPNYEDDEGGE
jgi:hypothetical protein